MRVLGRTAELVRGSRGAQAQHARGDSAGVPRAPVGTEDEGQRAQPLPSPTRAWLADLARSGSATRLSAAARRPGCQYRLPTLDCWMSAGARSEEGRAVSRAGI